MKSISNPSLHEEVSSPKKYGGNFSFVFGILSLLLVLGLPFSPELDGIVLLFSILFVLFPAIILFLISFVSLITSYSRGSKIVWWKILPLILFVLVFFYKIYELFSPYFSG